MAGTRKHEDKTREQTCDNTRETYSEITHGQNTDLTWFRKTEHKSSQHILREMISCQCRTSAGQMYKLQHWATALLYLGSILMLGNSRGMLSFHLLYIVIYMTMTFYDI